jgi:hypothetical protein
MQRGLMLLVLLLCSCAPGSPRATVTPPPNIEAEEYAVYSALIRRLPTGLVDSYRSRNAASYTLDPNLDVEQDYVLMPQEEFDTIFRRGGSVWARFQDRYPEASGMVIFSRVGFNADGDQALADMGYRCGDLCGAGGLYLLVKEEGNWKVQEELMAWQS